MTTETPAPSDDAQRIGTTYHEAGHAVMGCIRRRYPTHVDILADADGNVGHTCFEKGIPEYADSYLSDSPEKRTYIATRVMGQVAGSVAHDLHDSGRTHDSGDDNDDQLARRIIDERASWARNDRPGYLADCRSKATEELRRHWSWVKA